MVTTDIQGNFTRGIQSLQPIVYVLENFQRTFANLVVPHTDGTMKALVRCKGRPVL